MNATAWIAIVTFLGSVITQVVVSSFFFGRLAGRVSSNEENCDRHGNRLDRVDERLNSHGERISRVEARRTH